MIDILLPTLWRPDNLEPVLESLFATADGVRVTVICQAGDGATVREAERLGVRALTADGDPATVAEKINLGYRNTTGEFLFVGSDDIRFLPGWLDEALDAMDAANMVGVSDGIDNHVHDGELPGHVLIRRSYIADQSGVIDTPDSVLFEGYKHYYSDIEQWQTAASRGCWRSAHRARIEHLHPTNGRAQVDRTHSWSRSHMGADRALFESRRHLWA